MTRDTADRIIENVHTSYNVYLAKIRSAFAAIKNHRLSKSYMAMCEENGIVTPSFSWLGEAGSKFRTSGINTFFTNAYSLYKGNSYIEKLTNGNHETGLCGSLTQGDEVSTYTLNTVSPISGTQDAILAVTTVGTVGNRPRITLTRNSPTDLPIRIQFNYKVNSGSCVFSGIYNGTSYSGGGITLTGSGTMTTPSIILNNSINYIAFGSSSLFNVQIDNISIQEITPNSLDYDASQVTSTSQPLLTGNIARWERIGMENPNGASNFMTHSTITYASGDVWNISTVLKLYGFSTTQTIAIGGTNTKLRFTTLGKIEFINESNTTVTGTALYHKFVGKNTFFSFCASGAGTLLVYANGVLIETLTIATNSVFANLNAATLSLAGIFSSYVITTQNPSIALIVAEYNCLKALYPEIEGVTIGTKTFSSNCKIISNAAGTLIADGNVTGTWVVGTAFWCNHTDVANASVYGKLYNKAGRNVIIASPPSGWHVATEAENTALQLLGGAALKMTGSIYWTTANGTNTTLFTALGGGKRNADGSFSTIKGDAYFWCADSDKVLHITDAGVATIEAVVSVNDGYSIRLVKD